MRSCVGEPLKRSVCRSGSMDPIVLKDYSSEASFRLLEAQAFTELCGDMVVFRTMGGMFAGPSIDLIFLGLRYFELPNHLTGVRVFKSRDEQALVFGRSFNPKGTNEFCDRVFAVESRGKRFHVVGAKCWVFKYAKPQRGSAVSALNDLARRDAYIEREVNVWYAVE